MKKFVYTLPDLEHIAQELLSYSHSNIICLYGPMGVGKTTLVKKIIKKLNIDDPGNSPTFGIVNEYTKNNKIIAYHFDFYRINDIDEVWDLGIEEYLDSGKYIFIEWPELINEILPNHRTEIYLSLMTTGNREITIKNIVGD